MKVQLWRKLSRKLIGSFTDLIWLKAFWAIETKLWKTFFVLIWSKSFFVNFCNAWTETALPKHSIKLSWSTNKVYSWALSWKLSPELWPNWVCLDIAAKARLGLIMSRFFFFTSSSKRSTTRCFHTIRRIISLLYVHAKGSMEARAADPLMSLFFPPLRVFDCWHWWWKTIFFYFQAARSTSPPFLTPPSASPIINNNFLISSSFLMMVRA